MLDLDLTDTKTARALGLGKDTVAAYRKVAGSELAVKALDRYEWLTLDQAAALDEFAGDQDALTGLLRAAKNSPASFEDTLERMRARRDRDTSRAATVAQLAELGYRVKDDTRVAYYLDLDNLRKPAPEGSEAEDGGPVDPAEHAACEYAAVTIDYDYAWESDEAEQAWNHAHPEAAADGEDDDEQPDPMFDEDGEPSAEAAAAGYGLRWVVQQHYCEDPAAAGHVSVYGNRQEAMTPAEPGSAEANAEAEAAKKEAERESRRRLLRRNREWRAAGERRVRRLKVVLAQKDLPATSAQAAKRPDIPTAEAATRLIAGAIARRETEPNMMGSGHGLACELLGLPLAKPGAAEGYTVPLDAREVIQAAIDQASAGRVLVIELGMILAACEGQDGSPPSCADVKTWQHAEGRSWRYSGVPQSLRYLLWLEGHAGHELSDIEADVAHRADAEDDQVSPHHAQRVADAAAAVTVVGSSPQQRRQDRINAEATAAAAGSADPELVAGLGPRHPEDPGGDLDGQDDTPGVVPWIAQLDDGHIMTISGEDDPSGTTVACDDESCGGAERLVVFAAIEDSDEAAQLGPAAPDGPLTFGPAPEVAPAGPVDVGAGLEDPDPGRLDRLVAGHEDDQAQGDGGPWPGDPDYEAQAPGTYADPDLAG